MITLLIDIFCLLLLIHYILYLLKVPANKWTELLRTVIDPALDVTRGLMKRFLPWLAGKGIDWAPIVLFVALRLVCIVLGLLGKLPLIGWLF
ncbi:MAG: YggT family protein [Clostridia bacterium]|nr:YggT family protein [Clostridia bacterium]